MLAREIEFVAQLVDHVGNSADGAAAFEAGEIKSGTAILHSGIRAIEIFLFYPIPSAHKAITQA